MIIFAVRIKNRQHYEEIRKYAILHGMTMRDGFEVYRDYYDDYKGDYYVHFHDRYWRKSRDFTYNFEIVNGADFIYKPKNWKKEIRKCSKNK